MTAWLGEADPVQAAVDRLAERLGRSVVVDDPLIRLMYASRHFDDADPARVRAILQRTAAPEVIAFVLAQGVGTWTRPAVLPAAPELGLLPRLCVPLRVDATLLGLLMVIDAERTLTAAQTAGIDEGAREIAALLAGRAAAGVAHEQAVRALLGTDAAARDAARAGLPAHDGPVRVAVVEPVVDRALRTPAQVELALRTALVRADRVLGAVTPGPRAQLVHAALGTPATRLGEEVVRLLGGVGTVAVGVGGAVDGLAAAWRSARQADVALRGARLLPAYGGTAVWDALGPDAVLLSLPADALPDLVPAGLRALEGHGARLRDTLAAYLDAAGSVPRTAAALHLHRTSLHYRLRQIAEITGTDLDDGAARLALHLGLRTSDLLAALDDAD